jgi:hypothetical protein
MSIAMLEMKRMLREILRNQEFIMRDVAALTSAIAELAVNIGLEIDVLAKERSAADPDALAIDTAVGRLTDLNNALKASIAPLAEAAKPVASVAAPAVPVAPVADPAVVAHDPAPVPPAAATV